MPDKKKIRLLSLFLLSVLALPGWSADKADSVPYSELSREKLTKLKKESSCAFVHVWATWCTICLEELPGLLKTLAGEEKVRPIVLDVSSAFVQDNFSKKWLKSLAPPFEVYLKPKGGEEAYLNAIDPKWDGGLPYSAVYYKGQQKRIWNGTIKLNTLAQDIEAECQDERGVAGGS